MTDLERVKLAADKTAANYRTIGTLEHDRLSAAFQLFANELAAQIANAHEEEAALEDDLADARFFSPEGQD